MNHPINNYSSSCAWLLGSVRFENNPVWNVLEQCTELNGRHYRLFCNNLHSQSDDIQVEHGFSGWRRVALHVAQVALLPLTIIACLVKWTYRIHFFSMRKMQRSITYKKLSDQLDFWITRGDSSSQDGRRLAKNLLLSAYVNKLETINLDPKFNLDELPDCFEWFPFLRSLTCDHQRLTSLPSSLGNCKQLVVLNCSNNQLQSLPDSLKGCTQLKNLNCSQNQFRNLSGLDQLLQMEYCNLENNPFSEVTLLQLQDARAKSTRGKIVLSEYQPTACIGEAELKCATTSVVYPNIDSCLTLTFLLEDNTLLGVHCVLFPGEFQLGSAELIQEALQIIQSKGVKEIIIMGDSGWTITSFNPNQFYKEFLDPRDMLAIYFAKVFKTPHVSYAYARGDLFVCKDKKGSLSFVCKDKKGKSKDLLLKSPWEQFKYEKINVLFSDYS